MWSVPFTPPFNFTPCCLLTETSDISICSTPADIRDTISFDIVSSRLVFQWAKPESLNGTEHLENKSVYGRIILKCFLKIVLEDVECLHLARNRNQWRDFVCTPMLLQIS
jgi:hypothetical protein